MGGRLQARNCKDPILLYVKYIKIELAKKKNKRRVRSKPGKIVLHIEGGK